MVPFEQIRPFQANTAAAFPAERSWMYSMSSSSNKMKLSFDQGDGNNGDRASRVSKFMNQTGKTKLYHQCPLHELRAATLARPTCQCGTVFYSSHCLSVYDCTNPSKAHTQSMFEPPL